MTTEYEPDHPLYGRDAEWIADCARTRADSIMLEPGIVGPFSTALAHEYNRLKAKDGNRKRAEELYRKGIDNRDELIAELKSTHPPEDCLTRAIELRGAPEGSDWAGLLDHVGRLSNRHRAMCDGEKELRERAELAEFDLKDKIKIGNQNADLCLLRTDERDSVMVERDKLKAANEELEAKVKGANEQNSENWQRIDRLESELMLSTQNPELLARYAKIGSAGDLESMVHSHSELAAADLRRRKDVYERAICGSTPLTQIAADVAKIAANVERMVPNA